MGNVNITPIERPTVTWRGAKTVLLDSDCQRFWAKVERRGETECWPWLASRLGQDGYGQFVVMTAGGVSRKELHLYAHRVAWILTHGHIPDGSSVLHRCDNPNCVNPGHLFLGTQLDNMRDASAKGRLSRPHRRTRGIQPVVIERYLNGGVTADELAAQYGISKITVLRWVHRHVGESVDFRSLRSGRSREAVA